MNIINKLISKNLCSIIYNYLTINKEQVYLYQNEVINQFKLCKKGHQRITE